MSRNRYVMCCGKSPVKKSPEVTKKKKKIIVMFLLDKTTEVYNIHAQSYHDLLNKIHLLFVEIVH